MANWNTSSTPKIDDNSSVSLVSLAGGSHQDATVTAGNQYKINPEVDTFYKLSTGSSLYGTTSSYGGAGASPGWEFGSGALTASNLDLSTGDWTLELACIIPTTLNAATHFVYTLGDDSGGARISLKMDDAASSGIKLGISQADDAGTDVGGAEQTVTLNGITQSDTLIRHIAIVTVRNGASSSTTFWVDGAQVGQDTYTDNGVACDISSATGYASFGTNKAGTNHGTDMTLFDLKIYTTGLSSSQIQARTDALAPAYHVFDAAEPFLKYWIHCQNGTSLAHDSSNSYGIITYTAQNSATVALDSGGASATTSDSDVVWAKEPITISTGSATILNLYSQAGNAGDVRLIKL